jgi:hypothetical protein
LAKDVIDYQRITLPTNIWDSQDAPGFSGSQQNLLYLCCQTTCGYAGTGEKKDSK